MSAQVELTAVHAPRTSTFEGDAPSFAQQARDTPADEVQDASGAGRVLGEGTESDPGLRMTLGGDDAEDENARACEEQV